MRAGDKRYAPPPWSAEDSRCLINWLSTRVDAFGNVLDDCGYERCLVERQKRLARALGLSVVPGVYLPPSPSTKGATRRGKPGKRKAA